MLDQVVDSVLPFSNIHPACDRPAVCDTAIVRPGLEGPSVAPHCVLGGNPSPQHPPRGMGTDRTPSIDRQQFADRKQVPPNAASLCALSIVRDMDSRLPSSEGALHRISRRMIPHSWTSSICPLRTKFARQPCIVCQCGNASDALARIGTKRTSLIRSTAPVSQERVLTEMERSENKPNTAMRSARLVHDQARVWSILRPEHPCDPHQNQIMVDHHDLT
ncbi:hypothetical protein ACVIM9_008508 [Bradyrhizobium sp. USDA 4520]